MMQTVYATFSDPDMAEKAAGAVLDHGIRAEHISVVLPEGYARNESDVDLENHIEDKAEKGITTTTSADAASGAAKGAGFGLTAGALAALAALFIPGVGLVIGGGALAIAIGGAAGATAAGAVAGGVTGYLKDQGVPEGTVYNYGRVLSDGGALITVNLTDEDVDASTIEAVLTKYDGSISLHVNNGASVL